MVLAVVEDLLFATRIREAAKRAGATVEFASSAEKALEVAEAGPALAIIDLNFHKIQPLSLIARLKGRVPMVAFFSHVQVELRLEAEKAGCDRILPRSAFVQCLAEIFRGEVKQIAPPGH
jgi:CheY-like chemotaxis protein